jgi:hypothetical protein
MRSDVMNKVKNTFHKLVPARDRKEAPNFLVVMNVAPFMGRRDAAYDRVAEMLREDIFVSSDAERIKTYNSVIELLDSTIESTEAIISSTRDIKNEGENRLLQYFTLLREMVRAASALVEHELTLFKREDKMAELLGRETTARFRKIDEVFSESEMNIFQCISDILEMGNGPLERYREFSLKTLPKQNLDRSEKYYQAKIAGPKE